MTPIIDIYKKNNTHSRSQNCFASWYNIVIAMALARKFFNGVESLTLSRIITRMLLMHTRDKQICACVDGWML